jgi:hypothetical protein
MSADFSEGRQDPEAFAITRAARHAHPTNTNASSFPNNNLRKSASICG